MHKKIKLTFAGQAGFIIETADGYRIGIDLYLSDCCQRYEGLKRLMPFLFEPQKMDLDLLVATHAHYDHFDPDSVPLMMQNRKTKLIAARDVKEEAEKLCLANHRITYLKVGEIFENETVFIKAMPCDHGEEAPEAIGLWIETGGKKIYVAGDTCFREDYFINAEVQKPDVFILPINGAYGNMNEREGARATSLIKAKLSVPCHFWNFAEHFGNPYLFMQEMDEKYPDIPYTFMRMGETIEI